MASGFDYTKIHIFRKNGQEIPISLSSSLSITVKNKFDDNAVFYYVSSPDGYIESVYRKRSGNRFTAEDFPEGYDVTKGIPENICGDFSDDFSDDFSRFVKGDVNGTLITPNGEKSVSVFVELEKTASSSKDEYFVNNVSIPKIDKDDISYPSVTLNGKLDIGTVSTNLVETESLYLMVYDDETSKYVTIDEYASKNEKCNKWFKRFSIITYIDCKSQSDFRFFTVDDNEVVWSDRAIINPVSSHDTDNYRINVGFSGNDEGVYESDIFLCIVDSYSGDEYGNVYTIGNIRLIAETIGEDERYRALFANFGIPSPLEYENIYKDTDADEYYTDYVKMNRHMKEMFLSYHEIFPYVGTYKALLNAVKIVGYDDIFFKEWYVSTSANSGMTRYVAVDIPDFRNDNSVNMPQYPIEERISVKKANWISMLYKLCYIDQSSDIDKYGFPVDIIQGMYSSYDYIIKLISLRKWLEKYITGLGCRIIDICGEGIYFERYNQHTYGTYQTALEYDSRNNLAPYFTENNSIAIEDTSVNLGISIKSCNSTIESFGNTRLIDICIGSINIGEGGNGKFTKTIPDDTSIFDYICVSKDMTGEGEFESAYAVCETKAESFIFDWDSYTDSSYPRVIVEDGKIRILPSDEEEMGSNSVFKNLPVIEIEEGSIISSAKGSLNSIIYEIKEDDYKYTITDMRDGTVVNTNEAPTLSNDYSKYDSSVEYMYGTSNYEGSAVEYKESIFTHGFRYTANNWYRIPCFMISGYKSNDGFIDCGDEEFVISIKQGRILFDQTDECGRVELSFFNVNEFGIPYATVTVKYSSDEVIPTVYHNEAGDTPFAHFFENKEYAEFAELYQDSPNDAVEHNTPINVKVFHSGIYNGLVVTTDAFGGICRSKCINTSNVVTTNSTIFPYIISDTKYCDSDEKIDSEKMDTIMDRFKRYPITGRMYECETNISIPDSDDEPIGNFKDRYITNTYDSESNHLNIANTSDEFRIVSVIRNEFDNDDNLYRLECVLNRMSKRKFMPLDYSTDAESFDPSSETPFEFLRKNGETTSCHAVIFNTNGTFADIQLPGYMAKASIFGDTYSDEEYFLTIEYDDSIYNSIYINEIGETPDKVISVIVNGTEYTAGTFDEDDELYSYIKDKSDDNDLINRMRSVKDGKPVKIENIINEIILNTDNIIYIVPNIKFETDGYESDGESTSITCTKPYQSNGGKLKIIFTRKGTEFEGYTTLKTIESTVSDGKGIVKVASHIPNNDNFDIKVSPINTSYVTHRMEISTAGYDQKSRTVYVGMNNDDKTEEIINCIDGTFYPMMMKYDSRNLAELWTDVAYSNDKGKYVPRTNGMDMYRCNANNMFAHGQSVVFTPHRDDDTKTYDGNTYKWRIYDIRHNNRKLLMECYNKDLFMKIPDGLEYEIELSEYDKLGNKKTDIVKGSK